MMPLMRRPLLSLALALTAALAVAPAAANADPLLPPPGKVFTGVAAGHGAAPGASFDQLTGRRSAIFQQFVTFGVTGGHDTALREAAGSGARPMLHLSTADSAGHEIVTPGAIARGASDSYVIWLAGRLERVGGPTYVRLFAEMDGHWNPYSAFDASGRSRGKDHSPAAFRAAWRRIVLILRGGDRATVDARLAALRQPSVQTTLATLPAPQVAVLWVPQVAGAPDTKANAPGAARARGRGPGGPAGRRRAGHEGHRPGPLLARQGLRRLGRPRLLPQVPELPRAGAFCRRPPLEGHAVQLRRVGGLGLGQPR